MYCPLKKINCNENVAWTISIEFKLANVSHGESNVIYTYLVFSQNYLLNEGQLRMLSQECQKLLDVQIGKLNEEVCILHEILDSLEQNNCQQEALSCPNCHA